MPNGNAGFFARTTAAFMTIAGATAGLYTLVDATIDPDAEGEIGFGGPGMAGGAGTVNVQDALKAVVIMTGCCAELLALSCMAYQYRRRSNQAAAPQAAAIPASQAAAPQAAPAAPSCCC